MESNQNSYDFWPSGNTVEILNYKFSSERSVEDVTLATLDWFLSFSPKNEENKYSVELRCFQYSSSSTFWKCDMELEATFKNGSESKIVKVEQKCSSNRTSLKVEAHFENEAKDVSVDVRIKVKNVEGIRNLQRFDLLKEVPELGDVTLVIDEKKLKVNKACLAQYSSYFKNLFFGDFSEKNQQEVQIKDVDFEEFVDLMNVISPARKRILNDNVTYILKLSDRFDLQSVITQCEEFLVCGGCELDYKEILFLADKYRLMEVQYHCVCKLDAKELETIRKSELYDELSDATKAAMFEKAIRLMSINEKENEIFFP